MGTGPELYWPGSVHGLQLNTAPGEASRDPGDGQAGGTPATWSEAADLADRALADLVEKEARAGRDECGWSDAALKPAPLDLEAELAALRARIEKVTGSVDDPPPKNPARSIRAPGPKEVAQFVEWGRLARWLRGFRRRILKLAPILDPSFCPPTGWAASLGRDLVERRRKKGRAAPCITGCGPLRRRRERCWPRPGSSRTATTAPCTGRARKQAFRL